MRGVREVVVTHVVEVDQLVTLRRVIEQGVVLLGEGLADRLVLRVQGHLDSLSSINKGRRRLADGFEELEGEEGEGRRESLGSLTG